RAGWHGSLRDVGHAEDTAAGAPPTDYLIPPAPACTRSVRLCLSLPALGVRPYRSPAAIGPAVTTDTPVCRRTGPGVIVGTGGPGREVPCPGRNRGGPAHSATIFFRRRAPRGRGCNRRNQPNGSHFGDDPPVRFLPLAKQRGDAMAAPGVDLHRPIRNRRDSHVLADEFSSISCRGVYKPAFH